MMCRLLQFYLTQGEVNGKHAAFMQITGLFFAKKTNTFYWTVSYNQLQNYCTWFCYSFSACSATTYYWNVWVASIYCISPNNSGAKATTRFPLYFLWIFMVHREWILKMFHISTSRALTFEIRTEHFLKTFFHFVCFSFVIRSNKFSSFEFFRTKFTYFLCEYSLFAYRQQSRTNDSRNSLMSPRL